MTTFSLEFQQEAAEEYDSLQGKSAVTARTEKDNDKEFYVTCRLLPSFAKEYGRKM